MLICKTLERIVNQLNPNPVLESFLNKADKTNKRSVQSLMDYKSIQEPEWDGTHQEKLYNDFTDLLEPIHENGFKLSNISVEIYNRVPDNVKDLVVVAYNQARRIDVKRNMYEN